MSTIVLAAVLGLTVDTVLLIALAERRNRRVRQFWMVALAGAAWCWHAGAAGYFLLEDNPGQTAQPLRWWTMLLMVVGLLGFPCSLMHAVVRLITTGWFGRPERRSYEPFLYAPVLLAGPIAWLLHDDPSISFLQQVAPLVLPYLGAITVISLLAAAILWQTASKSTLPAGEPFLRWLSATLVTMTALLDVIILVVEPRWPEAYVVWYSILVLLPVPAAMLFAYFVLRYGFLPLVLERTVVCGGMLAVLVVLHRSLMTPLEAASRDRLGFDLVWLEAALAAVLIVSYQPIRRRVHEAMRYLISSTVPQFRREIRQAAIGLAAHRGNSPEELLPWFLQVLQRLPGVAAAQIVVTESSTGRRWENASEPLCSTALLEQVVIGWPADSPVMFADQAANRALTEELLRLRVTLLVRTEYEALQNLWCLRANPGGDGWQEEELNALVLLGEQWIAAVRHALLQSARAAAERRVWQAEKLSALGLLAGSLAHEIKNPLSSIKTLATVTLEDSPPDSEQAESLRLILQELDRLTQTTQQLLGFVRAGDRTSATLTNVAEALTATLQIVRHRARQQRVELKHVASDCATIAVAPKEAVQSLALNLILNAIEACPSGGLVTVRCDARDSLIALEVRDNGPGIPLEIQDSLFQPLVTTKADGTGLGLYSVAQTVRDLQGTIEVTSTADRGTTFRVLLPRSMPEGKA